MIEDCPILSINVKFWLFWSFIRYHNYKRYVIMVPVVSLNILQWMFLYRAEQIDVLILNAYFTVLYFNAVVRTIVTIKHADRFENYMENIEETFNDIENTGDHEMIKILHDYTSHMKKLSKSNLVMAAVANMCFVSYPLFTKGRGLPYGVWIPGVNNFVSPNYEILFFIQAIITCLGCFTYIPFSNIFVSFIVFGIVQVRLLQYRLINIKNSNDTNDISEQRLKECIQTHVKIISYVDELNNLVTYVSLLEFLSFAIMLCALLFLLAIVNNMAQMIIVYAYIFLIMTQLYTIYYQANKLLEESLKLSEAAYSSSWIEYSFPAKRMLLLIILRSQLPLRVMIGHIYPMTLEMFQSILNTAYTYFTILKRFYE